MRSGHRQKLSRPASSFAELDRLELGAALLERDAINNRAWLTELGKRPPYHIPRWVRFSRRGQKLWISALEYADWTGETAVAIYKNRRLRWALRTGFTFVLDLVCVVAALGFILAAIAVAYALFVPPI
ncbi:hypothetical protein [Hyphomicrobium sp. D-2]|uniref:hypothetical protein n=1 Tax=Hyphomicrobium sp. D-2 TaxID=3041621 RepID=UPI002457B4DD|nr:hypothetical protein [Hyphomicrobium sp. D-2]MDH4982346.1 hypothetical protein [Hyphomicrobium sp. D-2]